MARYQSFKHKDSSTQQLFQSTYQVMEELLVMDNNNLRAERQITTNITTGTAEGSLYKGEQRVVFTRAFAASPVVYCTAQRNTAPVWTGDVVSRSLTAATVSLFSTSATRTGKVRLLIIGK